LCKIKILHIHYIFIGIFIWLWIAVPYKLKPWDEKACWSIETGILLEKNNGAFKSKNSWGLLGIINQTSPISHPIINCLLYTFTQYIHTTVEHVLFYLKIFTLLVDQDVVVNYGACSMPDHGQTGQYMILLKIWIYGHEINY
jgi:hypothetical protein